MKNLPETQKILNGMVQRLDALQKAGANFSSLVLAAGAQLKDIDRKSTRLTPVT